MNHWKIRFWGHIMAYFHIFFPGPRLRIEREAALFRSANNPYRWSHEHFRGAASCAASSTSRVRPAFQPPQNLLRIQSLRMF